jgi:hypothetical protein
MKYSFRHVNEVPQPRAGVNVSALLAGGSLDVGYQDGGHPAAGFSVPMAHSRIWVVFRPHRAAGATGWLVGAASGPAGSINVPGQRIPQLPIVPGVQLDLVLGAVQPEADGTLAALPSRSSMSRICIF